MSLLLASYSEQSFILSVFRKINKHKYTNTLGQNPDNLIPKMGRLKQISFLCSRFFNCSSSAKALRGLYDKTSEELEKELEILYLIKNFRFLNELVKKEAQFDDECPPSGKKKKVEIEDDPLNETFNEATILDFDHEDKEEKKNELEPKLLKVKEKVSKKKKKAKRKETPD